MTKRVRIGRWSSLSHICTIKKTSKKELYQWHCLREEENKEPKEASLWSYEINNWHHKGKTHKKDAAWFYQLKVRHTAVEVFLKWIRVNESGSCWSCYVISPSHLHKLQKVEKRKKKLKERANSRGHKVAEEARNEVASESLRKRTSVTAFAWVF